MRKIYISILLVFAVCSVVGQNFRGGLRAGFTATQMSGDELSGFHKMGAYAGGFVNWRFVQNEHWFLQPEINFVMKGSSTFLRADKNGNVMGNKYVLTLYYVEVPVLAKYRIVKGLEVEFGPTFGILFAATEKDANGKMPGRMPFRRFELCGLAGVSYIFKEHLGLNLRFVQTAIPVRVNDGNHSSNYLEKKQFSTEIAFSVFYQF
ncbi:MAG: PorT family protein [Bacteroidales bacterium]|nr:PorT family protein [Bacteroidales bacterium]